MTEIVDRSQAVHLLLNGRVVGVPTDTVYGLAASLWREDAVASLFRLKVRPSHVALPVLVHTLNPIQEIDVEWGESAQQLAEEFWPGPLTIVVPASAELARRVGGSKDSVGVRVPDDELMLSVLRECGPLTVSSANSHGEPPCHSAPEVVAALGGDGLAGVLDGGERRGEISTVVEVGDGLWRVLREGSISSSRIAEVLD
jgi:tRNA threonylcarbamoyl adenosine modification protein (Sua5/YciO/YrdC/YwlC family)